MSKKFKDVRVEYASCYFDIEIDDREIEFAKNCRIDVEDNEELVKFHLENNFQEHADLLNIDDFDSGIEVEEE